jgi:hypothetical protein
MGFYGLALEDPCRPQSIFTDTDRFGNTMKQLSDRTPREVTRSAKITAS